MSTVATPFVSKDLSRFVPGSVETTEVSTRRPLRLKATGRRISVGTRASVVFGRIGEGWWMKVTATVEGETVEFLTRHVTSFFSPPTDAQLSEFSDSASCETVLGSTAEPDGYDEDGSPSWLIALGLI